MPGKARVPRSQKAAQEWLKGGGRGGCLGQSDGKKAAKHRSCRGIVPPFFWGSFKSSTLLAPKLGTSLFFEPVGSSYAYAIQRCQTLIRVAILALFRGRQQDRHEKLSSGFSPRSVSIVFPPPQLNASHLHQTRGSSAPKVCGAFPSNGLSNQRSKKTKQIKSLSQAWPQGLRSLGSSSSSSTTTTTSSTSGSSGSSVHYFLCVSHVFDRRHASPLCTPPRLSHQRHGQRAGPLHAGLHDVGHFCRVRLQYLNQSSRPCRIGSIPFQMLLAVGFGEDLGVSRLL